MDRAPVFELQLGQLCNNRCVFCVSGRLTSKGEAPLLDAEVLRAALDDAKRAGHRSVTFLGGEPTIQPFFLDLVRHAVALGFEPIVIFSNGSKPGRTDLVDEVVATGGRFEWRFSFQGATREAHERTTRRRGSWDQLLRAVARAGALGQRITVNMCMVKQNLASLPAFAELLLPLGVSQLHVDVVDPSTIGDEHLDDVQPRYGDLVAPLERMIEGFPRGFDVNIGNLPFCVAPRLASFIHHGGAPTWTVAAADGVAEIRDQHDKYLVKAERKLKVEACRDCVFDGRCTGVFARYAKQHGLGELRPITADELAVHDGDGRLFSIRLCGVLDRAFGSSAPPLDGWTIRTVEESDDEVRIQALGPGAARVELALRAESPSAIARGDGLAMSLVETTLDPISTHGAAAQIWSRLVESGVRSVVPPLDPRIRRAPPAVQAALARLRRAAPFGALSWRALHLSSDATRIELALALADERATAWLSGERGRLTGGYRVEGNGDATSAMRDGIAALMRALSSDEKGAAPSSARP